MKFILPDNFINNWSYLGFTVRYVHNDTSDITLKSNRDEIYIDRFNKNQLFSVTTNITFNEEVAAALAYTLKYLNNLVRKEKELRDRENEVIWTDSTSNNEDTTEDDDLFN